MKLNDTRNTTKYRKCEIGWFIVIVNDLLSLTYYKLLIIANFSRFYQKFQLFLVDYLY